MECVQNDFYANGMFSENRAPILHWHYNEIPPDPRHLRVPSSASKTIYDQWHLVYHYLQTEQTELH
jgi:hypothetical protein